MPLAYNTGSLENANGVKLVSTGRNIWDEQWEAGSISGTTGNNSTSSVSIRSKNLCHCIPNTEYYFKHTTITTAGGKAYIFWYDSNSNYISNSTGINNIYNSPNNAFYFKVVIDYYIQEHSTYNHDITISLYYTPEQGGEGYNQYYQYEQPYVVDTGSEVLRSAGSVCDYKEPNGTIHRLVGTITFDGSEDEGWVMHGDASYKNFRWTNNPIQNLVKKPTSNSVSFNGLCNNLSIIDYNSRRTVGYANISIDTDGYIGIVVTASSVTDLTTFKTWLSNNNVILYYELATPTTEQGTPFAENLPINDYGMLYWLDSSNNLVGIPQGAKIFYPTNYKGFVDDMYSRVDGDSSAYVIQSELSASETQRDTIDTQLKNAIGGTLRQLLASSQNIDFLNTDFVDLGTLDWSYVSNGSFFLASQLPAGADVNNNIVCSLYKAQAVSQDTPTINMIISLTSQLRVRNLSYTDATTFKNAMKGVLLAYEKA